jgi:hypothetical protein
MVIEIRNFHTHTSIREATPENPERAIPESGGNNNPPPPKDHTKENPQDNDKKFNYIEYCLNVIQRLGGDNPENLILAAAITNKQLGVLQQTAPLNRSQKSLVKNFRKKLDGFLMAKSNPNSLPGNKK